MSTGPIFIPWQHNAIPGATPLLIGTTADADFPIANAADGDPQVIVKLVGASALVLWDFGSAVHISSGFLGHHNLDANLTVAWVGFTVQPTLITDPPDLEVPVTPRAADGYGYRPDLWADVDTVDAVGTYRYQGWAITGVNTQNVRFGEVVADTERRAMPADFLIQGAAFGWELDTIRHRLYGGGTLKATKAPPVKRFSGAFGGTKAEIDELVDWFMATAAAAQSCVLIPDPDGPDAHLVEYVEDSLQVRYAAARPQDAYSLDLAWRELSRGLVHP